MKKIAILLLFISSLCFGQIDYNGSKYMLYYRGSHRITENPIPLIKSWVNFEGLTETSTTLTDLSGYGNNWTLKNSNCLNFTYTNYVALASTFYIPLNKNYFVDFYASTRTAANGYNVICGQSATNYIRLTTTGVGILSPAGTLTFDQITVPLDGVIRHFRINIKNDTIQVIDYTGNRSQKKLNTLHDSILVDRIGNRHSSSGNLDGYIFGVNFNNLHVYPFSEGTYQQIFDAGLSATPIHGTIQVSTTNVWQKQDLYHYNLVHGYTLWNRSIGSLPLQPHKINGDTITATYPLATKIGNFSGGNYHNGCETGVSPPLSLLTYDYSNYLFTGGVPNVLYYSTFQDNVGNRIFMDTLIPYQYRDITVYDKEYTYIMFNFNSNAQFTSITRYIYE